MKYPPPLLIFRSGSLEISKQVKGAVALHRELKQAYQTTHQLPTTFQTYRANLSQATVVKPDKQRIDYNRPRKALRQILKKTCHENIVLTECWGSKSGLQCLNDFGGLSDMYWVMATHRSFFEHAWCHGSMQQVIKHARRIVILVGGWTSHPAIWNQFIQTILLDDPKNRTLVIALQTPGMAAESVFGITDPWWYMVQEVLAYDHTSMKMIFRLWLNSLGILEKLDDPKFERLDIFGHSYFGATLLHWFASEWHPKLFIRAWAPALNSSILSPYGDYMKLSLATYAGGKVPGFLGNKGSDVLVGLLTKGVDFPIPAIHKLVAKDGHQRGYLDGIISASIGYLAEQQGKLRQIYLPPNPNQLLTFLGSADTLVDFKPTFHQLVEAGLDFRQQIEVYPAGHYGPLEIGWNQPGTTANQVWLSMKHHLLS